MNIPGPLSISAVNAPHHQELDLRPFQRVTAQVLSITGTTALLSIEGYPVVAQLASADQAASLLPQQTAQFIVVQRTKEKITLKVVSMNQPQVNLAASTLPAPELAMRLLEQQDIPVTANHLIIARAVLKKHLPVTPVLLNELLETLSASGPWGDKEANLAAALKAAGLPLNAESLTLASRQAAQIGDSLARLIGKLTDMVGDDLPKDLLKQLDLNFQLLNQAILDSKGEPHQLAEQLKGTVEILGRSLENALLEGSQASKEHASDKSLVSLVRLQQMLEQIGNNDLAHGIGEFLNDLRLHQFLNAKLDPTLGQGEWTEIGFAIRNLPQGTEEEFSSARLRIARDPRPDSGRINPAYTRLILQVDLRPGQTVEVDLSVVDKQIRTSVTSPDAVWCRRAQEELPALEEALQGLGFRLADTQIHVGKAHSFERLEVSGGSTFMTVDIEI